MAVVEMNGVTFGYGGSMILREAALTIETGEHVGLVGANGAGKSTILRLLDGVETPQSGTIRYGSKGTTIVVVPQFFPEQAAGPAREFVIADVLSVRERLRDLEEAMALADGEALPRILASYGTVRERYDAVNGDEAEARAETLLDSVGMGYAADTDVTLLSGGERNRIQIARALASRPDLLVLDEPGNHLDIWGLDWLERTLADLPCAVLIVSHNRYLLDRVVTRILELRDGRVTSWTGSYSAYRAARLREAVRLAQDARADAQHIARIEAQVAYLAQLARAVADSSIGKRLRASRSHLERVREEARERPELTEARSAIRLNAPVVRADVAVELREVDVVLGERVLLRDASLKVHVGERVALLGANGCGKTTLLRRIVSEGDWNDDHIRVGPSMRIGYCSQHQELFDPDRTLEEAISAIGGGARDRVFGLLSRYRFVYQDLDRSVRTLSGGERNRLQLARAEVIGANLLILDEPTNHLDIGEREAVEEALLAFQGTIIVVSHDRYLLDAVATRIVAFEGETLASYDLPFREWWRDVGRRGTRRGTSVTHTRRAPGAASDRAGRTAPGRETTAEERLVALEEEIAEIERKLTGAYERNDLATAAKLSKKLGTTRAIFDRMYAEW